MRLSFRAQREIGPPYGRAPCPSVRAARSLATLGMTFLASLALSATVLLGQTSLPQTNAERILSGRDTPSHDYDLIHQRIEVRNFDWDATAFDGKVTTTIVSLRPGLDSIVLDMERAATEIVNIVTENTTKPL